MNGSSSQKIVEKVKMIGDFFFDPSSPLINIDADILSEVRKKLDSNDETILNDLSFFDQTASIVEGLLRCDSLIKWKKSNYFSEALLTSP